MERVIASCAKERVIQMAVSLARCCPPYQATMSATAKSAGATASALPAAEAAKKKTNKIREEALRNGTLGSTEE
jgi:hypothetical protein